MTGDPAARPATAWVRLRGAVGRLLGRTGSADFREFAPLVASLRTPGRSAGVRPAAVDRDLLARVVEVAEHRTGFTLHPGQVLGACALIAGNAIEMDTGEGKTLTGALAASVLALGGRRVHVLSPNDFLARRDAEWMAAIYADLDLTVGWITSSSTTTQRREAYARDITYAPMHEVGYDLLRDRLALRREERVSPAFEAALVDEADALLIDEAVTPLVLAGSLDVPGDGDRRAAEIVALLEEGPHFDLDRDGATASFTDLGLDLVEHALGGVDLYSGDNVELLTTMNLALHARAVLRRDVDYLVTDGAVRLVDASRGRVARLQRWPDGLHAAVEAKEGLAVSSPGLVLDSITVHDLALRYRSLSGMSGTLAGVADDLLEFYRLRSGRIPPHRPRVRIDHPDVVLPDRESLVAAATEQIARLHAHGRPVLVGTQSVAESEEIADRLRALGMPAVVLNARNDAAEAAVITRAGEPGAVTISTQISGRGTDIVLGGADGADRDRVVAAGGLAVVALGRFPSRRLDAQLRGRSGRQGDPGSTYAFSSLDDEIVRSHPPDRLPKPGTPARAALTPRRRRALVDAAQRIAEHARLERHRSTWAYSRAIAAQRAHVLDVRETLLTASAALELAEAATPAHVARLIAATSRAAVERALRALALAAADASWADHLALLQEVRDGIHLRALAGERPLDAFHSIALAEFDGWRERLEITICELSATLTPDDVERGAIPSAVRRPSATWTYMMSDDPLGDPVSRIARRRTRDG